MTSPADILQQIQARLAQQPPTQIIEELSPRTRTDAVSWARRLPLWDDFSRDITNQAIAVARVISRRAMREYGLTFDSDGRVGEQKPLSSSPERPTRIFHMKIGEETVEVRYVRRYFPQTGQDLFSFVGEKLPGEQITYKPHPLSESGWWSHFASHDAVEAMGSPEAYATRYAEAKLRGDDFEAVFEGKRPEGKPKNGRKQPKEEPVKPVIGQHTAQVIQEQVEQKAEEPLSQKSLFEEMP
jgi:hypothetical protein